jgi:hypothetical protein
MLITEEKMETVIKELQNSNLNRSSLSEYKSSTSPLTISTTKPPQTAINESDKQIKNEMSDLTESGENEEESSQQSNFQKLILSKELKQFINENREDDLNQMKDYCSTYLQVIPYTGSPFISLCSKPDENAKDSNELIRLNNETDKEFNCPSLAKNSSPPSNSFNFSTYFPVKQTYSSSEPKYNVEEPTEPSHHSLKR